MLTYAHVCSRMLTYAAASKRAERLAQVEQELAEKQKDFEKERERVVKTETQLEVLQAQVHTARTVVRLKQVKQVKQALFVR